MAKNGRTYVSQSISFTPEMLREAKARADRLDLTLSAYVQKCVEADLKTRGAIIYEERDPNMPAFLAAEAPTAKEKKSHRSK